MVSGCRGLNRDIDALRSALGVYGIVPFDDRAVDQDFAQQDVRGELQERQEDVGTTIEWRRKTIPGVMNVVLPDRPLAATLFGDDDRRQRVLLAKTRRPIIVDLVVFDLGLGAKRRVQGSEAGCRATGDRLTLTTATQYTQHTLSPIATPSKLPRGLNSLAWPKAWYDGWASSWMWQKPPL
jgi:hypothetical protein